MTLSYNANYIEGGQKISESLNHSFASWFFYQGITVNLITTFVASLLLIVKDLVALVRSGRASTGLSSIACATPCGSTDTGSVARRDGTGGEDVGS